MDTLTLNWAVTALDADGVRVDQGLFTTKVAALRWCQRAPSPDYQIERLAEPRVVYRSDVRHEADITGVW